jgi:hypothetical protein
MGVRMGSGDFYRVIETMPEISESLSVGARLPGGKYWMPLFVVPQPRITLDAAGVRRGSLMAPHTHDAPVGAAITQARRGPLTRPVPPPACAHPVPPSRLPLEPTPGVDQAAVPAVACPRLQRGRGGQPGRHYGAPLSASMSASAPVASSVGVEPRAGPLTSATR